ncbi:MAG: putative integral rane protein [Bacteroidetes bacterium]|nr:putative integral rane protein [Bacteroidota bacterium]
MEPTTSIQTANAPQPRMAEEHVNLRLEAFCDAVFAIALTLLIIDIKLPSSIIVNDTAGFWFALRHIAPSIFAFVLSFIVILITWVNHHAFMKLVNKTSTSFMYANGFLLLTVVFVPFPTALIGDFVLTDHAAPAVFLYNAVLAIQGVAWVLLSSAVLQNHLEKNEPSSMQMLVNRRNGYVAFIVYSLLAIIAFWFPLTIAIVTTLTWVFWLIFGISISTTSGKAHGTDTRTLQ